MQQVYWHNLKLSEVKSKLNTDFNKGLTSTEAKRRLEKFGKNIIPQKEELSLIKLFFSQFRSPLVYILLAAGIITLIFKKYTDSLVIFAAVIVNSIFGYFEEFKVSRVLQKLSKTLKSYAIVIRDGNPRQVSQSEICPGDLILISPGDKIPADGRLVEAKNLEVDESILTGEWLPAKKKVTILPELTPLADTDNMVYAGCLVKQGSGKAVVTATGTNTEIGKIARMVGRIKEKKTPLQQRLAGFGKTISLVIVLICILIWLGGIFRQQDAIEMFETAVAMAVAGVPEALPVIITLVLAIGMERVLKKKGLIRKLASVETLGSTSIICCDKTRTLTQGKMSVAEVFWVDHSEELAFKIAGLSNAAYVENPDKPVNDWIIRGSPTDQALFNGAIKAGFSPIKFKKQNPLIFSLPFDPSRKYQAYLYANGLVAISGAPEVLIELSNLSQSAKENLNEKLNQFTSEGLRVIGVAYKYISRPKLPNLNHLDKLIHSLNFVGLVALEDPLRKEVKDFIKLAEQAKINSVMITGDHSRTALFVAKKLGLKVEPENILEGKELDKLTDQQFDMIIEKIKIYARAEPRHKLRIVNAFQKKGKVIAMTGDGVNDAPALKAADVGVALGSGTEVAKQASDLVLLNDNFSTIVESIKEGRVILDNIRKSIAYVLADSFTEVILIGVSTVIFGWPLPILPAQILWNNIVEDTLPCISYAFEPAEKGVMKREPTSPNAPLLTREMKVLIFGTGLIDEFFMILLFFILWKCLNLDLSYVRTMIFGAISIDTAFVIYSYKNLRKNLFRINPFSNKFLVLASVIVFVGLIAAIYLPVFQTLLHTVPLRLLDWLILIGIGILSLFLVEATKWYFISRHQTE